MATRKAPGRRGFAYWRRAAERAGRVRFALARAGGRVFRLPGIYGPERSAFERIEQGKAHRIDLPGQVFSRVHVSDIAAGVVAAIERDAAPGAYNLADDLPSSQNSVIEEGLPPAWPSRAAAAAIARRSRSLAHGARLLRLPRTAVSRMARLSASWLEPRYPTYREGLAALRGSA